MYGTIFFASVQVTGRMVTRVMKSVESQYKKLKDIVYKECGINLHEGKDELLKSRLSKRLRIKKIDSVDTYIKLIQNDKNELSNFIDTVTTNHTFLFRENRHCEFIKQALNISTHLKIWSSASSSGEEPYSIAVQLIESGYKFNMFASDISNEMLKLAQRGIYTMDKARQVPVPILHKYFQKGHGKFNGSIRVKNEVKKFISFGKHNLIEDPSPGLFDVIFCRNVMIYFDAGTKQDLIKKLYNSLKDGGYFVIGAAEGLVGLEHDFKYIEPSIYIK